MSSQYWPNGRILISGPNQSREEMVVKVVNVIDREAHTWAHQPYTGIFKTMKKMNHVEQETYQ